jgi:hypothetical protein
MLLSNTRSMFPDLLVIPSAQSLLHTSNALGVFMVESMQVVFGRVFFPCVDQKKEHNIGRRVSSFSGLVGCANKITFLPHRACSKQDPCLPNQSRTRSSNLGPGRFEIRMHSEFFNECSVFYLSFGPRISQVCQEYSAADEMPNRCVWLQVPLCQECNRISGNIEAFYFFSELIELR